MSSDYESPTGSVHKDISMGIYMDNHESQRVDKGSGYGYPGTNMDKRHVSYGIDMDKETGLTWIIMDIKLHNLKENI